MLNDVEFREVQEVAKVDKVKIVACDGKSKYTWINFAVSLSSFLLFVGSVYKDKDLVNIEFTA